MGVLEEGVGVDGLGDRGGAARGGFLPSPSKRAAASSPAPPSGDDGGAAARGGFSPSPSKRPRLDVRPPFSDGFGVWCLGFRV